MKITETKTTTELYDANGKKISIVRSKETIIEVCQTIIPKNRIEGIQVRESIEVYKVNLENAKKIKANLEKVKGSKKGGQIFHSVADLIMVVDRPVFKTGDFQTITGNPIIEASLFMDSNFKPGPAKKKKNKMR